MTNRLPREEDRIDLGQAAIAIDLRWDPDQNKLVVEMIGAPNYGIALAMLAESAQSFKEEYESRVGTVYGVDPLMSKMFSRSYQEKPKEWDREDEGPEGQEG